MRTLGLTLTAMLMMAGLVHGQVAAPRLNNLAISAGVIRSQPVNPAVMPWDGISLVGLGLLNVDGERTSPGNPAVSLTGDGTALQARLVGESIAFGVESNSIEVEDSQIPPGTKEFGNTYVALAFKVGDLFSFGLGQQSFEDIDLGETREDTMPFVGGVLKLGESFYLGGTFGAESVEITQTGSPADTGERNVTRFGVSFYRRDNDGGFHLEIYQETTDVLSLKDTTGLEVFVEDSTTTGATFEFLFGNFLIGLETSTHETVQVQPGTVDELEEKITVISLGWVPAEGFNLVGGIRSFEETNATNPNVTSVDTVILGLGWSF